MADWQITAKTITCKAIAEDVTLTVKNDMTVKCSGYDKLKYSRRAQLQLVERSLDLKRSLDCSGMSCIRITEYLEKLRVESGEQAQTGGENK